MSQPTILIVTPALAAANNGNWRTTDRWQQFLSSSYRVEAAREYTGQACDLLIGLHARRSAPSISEFARTGKPLLVVLTGTDLYRDIHQDEQARQSLQLADQLVVLQEQGVNELDPNLHNKCHVIEQSAPSIPRINALDDCFELTLVGHVRAEKDPMTALRAMAHVSNPTLRLNHIGKTDDPQLGPAFEQLAATDSRVQLLGQKTHQQSRELIARSRALLLPSIMEGGANVLIEAVTSQVPVLASRIAGSIGLLGENYPGYFDVGNDEQLAGLIKRFQQAPDFQQQLIDHCATRAHLFEPAREARLLNELVAQMLDSASTTRNAL